MNKKEKLKRWKKNKSVPMDEKAARREAERRGLRLLSYEVHYKPMGRALFPKEAEDAIQEVYPLALESPKKAIGRLRKLIIQFPQVPQFRNYLGAALGATGQTAEQEVLAKESFELFYDYLFAWVNYGQVLLRQGKLEEVEALFPNGIEPQMMYPERKAFHVTEVNAVYMLAATYRLKKGDIDVAENLLEIMREVAPESPEAEAVERDLEMAVLKRNAEKFPFRRR